jgi:E3 ubiquitin-protein ligase MARCH5
MVIANMILFHLLQGGIAFIAFKGAIKMYYKQQQYIRQAMRVIKDYEDDVFPNA